MTDYIAQAHNAPAATPPTPEADDDPGSVAHDLTAALRERRPNTPTSPGAEVNRCARLGPEVQALIDDYDQIALALMYATTKEHLDRAEAELQQRAETESADAAAGSYALRAETAEARLGQVRAAVHISGNDDHSDWQRGYRACSNRALTALAPAPSCSPAVPETEPNNPAATAQATVTVTVTAPNPVHAVRWAGHVRDLVHAEFGTSMGLHSFIELEPEHATSVTPAEQQRDQLAATLDEVLRHFVHKGHPGEPCLQTGWISERTVTRWRDALNPPEEQQPYPPIGLTNQEQTP